VLQASQARSMSWSLSEPVHRRSGRGSPGRSLDRVEITVRGDREAGLDDVDAQLDQAWATSSFSPMFMLQPGDCSPSRSVVSKILIVACFSQGGSFEDWIGAVLGSRRRMRSQARPIAGLAKHKRFCGSRRGAAGTWMQLDLSL